MSAKPTAIPEQFMINGSNCNISPQDGGFRVWWGGCAIHYSKTLTGARCGLHNFAKDRCRTEVGNAAQLLASAQEALERLGDDSFYLGRFTHV
jgi:hypothetical protein